MDGRVVVDCSLPLTGDPDRAETLAEIASDSVSALLAGDVEAAAERILTWREVAALPTVDEAIERLPSATP